MDDETQKKEPGSYCNELAAVYGDGYSPAVSNCRLLLDIIHFLREGHRFSDREFRANADFPGAGFLGGFVRVLNHSHQFVHRLCQALFRNIDGSQRRRGDLRVWPVVETDDGDIPRYFITMFRECAKGAAGHGVIVTDKCVGVYRRRVTLKNYRRISGSFLRFKE